MDYHLTSFPLLEHIKSRAKWDDEFPSRVYRPHVETWLRFAQRKSRLNSYTPRLVVSSSKRDEVFAEIAAAYLLDELLGFPITEWEPSGNGNTKGEFLISVGEVSVFCEVKSPGWERDVVAEQGPGSPRLRLPKLQHAEVRWPDNSVPVRAAIEKAYGKFRGDMPNLLIVNDDLFDPLLDDELPIEQALWQKAVLPQNVQEKPIGCFVTDACKLLSGLLVMNKPRPLGNNSGQEERSIPVPEQPISKPVKGSECIEGMRYDYSLYRNEYASRPLPDELVRRIAQ
jgi:hypothetical protein